MKKLVLVIAALVVATTTGCAAGKAEYLRGTMPDGTIVTVVSHAHAPSLFADAKKQKFDYVYKGRTLSKKQRAAKDTTLTLCRGYASVSSPNEVVEALTYGGAYGLAGFVGVGLGGSKALPGNQIPFSSWGGYGAAAGGLAGLVGGVLNAGQDKVYNFNNCGITILNDMYSKYGIRVLQTTY